nr:MAG TPA: hypothetical protein [Caudoviricetes sp.]DAO43241.1 MAG TPA: hypothetical protein [Caudoviricetes sp.]
MDNHIINMLRTTTIKCSIRLTKRIVLNNVNSF